MTLKMRPLGTNDRGEWDRLYSGYADFYQVRQTAEMRDKVWTWLMDGDHELQGLLADWEGTAVGLTHFRPYASPLRATTNCFLDDLFVDQDHRKRGVARALIEAVRMRAEQNGWGAVRWTTADDNYRARALYDKLATRTMWITYEMKL